MVLLGVEEVSSQHPLGLAIPAPQISGLKVESFNTNCHFGKEYQEENFKVIEKKSLNHEVSQASNANHKTWKIPVIQGNPRKGNTVNPRHLV